MRCVVGLLVAGCSLGPAPRDAAPPPAVPAAAPAVVPAPWCEWSLECSATADTQPGGGTVATIRANLSLLSSPGAEREHEAGPDIRPLPACTVVAIGAGRLVPAAVHDGAAAITVPAGRYVLRFDSCYGCRIHGDGERDLAIVARAGSHTAVDVRCTELHK